MNFGISSVRNWIFMLIVTAMPRVALADHNCDASISEPGWKMIASRETVDVKDGAPVQTGGDWFVERTITVLPLCNYINAAGNYSLRSYSLAPETKTERVAVCKGATAVPPYKGVCPPK